jgi:hypothetical protein
MLTWRAKLRELLSNQQTQTVADQPESQKLPGDAGQQTWRDRGPQPTGVSQAKEAPLATGEVSLHHQPEAAYIAPAPSPPRDSTGRIILRKKPTPRRRVVERVCIERGVGP